MRFNHYVRIAGLTFCIENDHDFPKNEAFAPFITEESEPDFRIVFNARDSIDVPHVSLVHRDDGYLVYETSTGEYLRCYFDAMGDESIYAVRHENTAADSVNIDYLRSSGRFVSEWNNSFFHIGFEALLLKKKRVNFHAAFINSPCGGILFSGPSGIGKSTQAELWCRFNQSRLINGDRPIVYIENGNCIACGSPYAGSSRCHVNESAQVSAIVMLKQAKTNSVRRLGKGEAFRAVFRQITVNVWDRAFVDRVLDAASEMSACVPVYELCCTPDRNAVLTLSEALERDNICRI